MRIKRLIDSLWASDAAVESITFVTNMPTQSESYSHLLVQSLDEATEAIISFAKRGKIDVAVFDCLDYCESAYAECKKKSVVTIGIDTSSSQSLALDVLVNPVINNQLSHLMGAFYSIHHIDTPQLSSVIDKKSIFICFGGIDYQNHFAGVAPFIASFFDSYEINIVLASENNFYFDNNFGDNVNLFYRPNNFYELLNRSHIAIISGGILLQECLFMGIPAYVFPQYDHQFKIAKEKESAEMVLGVSDIEAEYKDSVDSILSVIEDKPYLDQIALKCRASDDGYGLSRVTSILRLIDYMSWDSKFFGKEIYTLNAKSYTPSIKKKIDAVKEQKEINLIYFLCPSSNSSSIDFALKDGFECVDERLTYLVTKVEFNSAVLDRKYCIKRSTHQDITRLQFIAAKSRWTTRYYNDKKFPKDRLQKFYSEWVKKSVSGELDDMVFHIEEAGTIFGFVTIKKNGSNLGSIGLIAVVKEAQGKGFGIKLAAHAVNTLINDLGCAAVEVVTQKNNTPACKTYERLGFKVFNNSTWLHKWI